MSIAVSVILFLTINFFCNSVARANQFEIDIPYQVVASCSLSESDSLRKEISEMDGVDAVYCAGMIQYIFKADIADKEFIQPDFSELEIVDMAVVIVDDKDFDKLLEDNGLDRAKYYGDTLRGVLLNNYFHDKKSPELFNSKILGQSLHYDETEGFPPAIEVADFAKYDAANKTYLLTPKGTITVYVPYSMYYKKAVEVLPEDKLTVDLGVETKRSAEVRDNIYTMMETEGYHNYSCSDLTDTIKIMDTITLMLKTAMYGFTVLLTLIAVANIINTISTGILLRRKEFAMQVAVLRR